MKNYLVPMWSYKNKQIKNHLALIEANDRYEAMLCAVDMHNYPEKDNEHILNDLSNVDWHVDMNYSAYQECHDPENLFTYMNRCAKIKTNQIEEDTHMDIYDYMYWGDYNARIKELAERHYLKNGVLKTKMIIVF